MASCHLNDARLSWVLADDGHHLNLPSAPETSVWNTTAMSRSRTSFCWGCISLYTNAAGRLPVLRLPNRSWWRLKEARVSLRVTLRRGANGCCTASSTSKSTPSRPLGPQHRLHQALRQLSPDKARHDSHRSSLMLQEMALRYTPRCMHWGC